LYLTLIPLAVIFVLIYSFGGAVNASSFAVLAGAGWVLVWFVAVLVALDPISGPRRRPRIFAAAGGEPLPSARALALAVPRGSLRSD
jgi:hypothetical protein